MDVLCVCECLHSATIKSEKLASETCLSGCLPNLVTTAMLYFCIYCEGLAIIHSACKDIKIFFFTTWFTLAAPTLLLLLRSRMVCPPSYISF